MYTNVELIDGVLRMKLEDGGAYVDEKRWRAAMQPAILYLSQVGGGTLTVPHTEADLSG